MERTATTRIGTLVLLPNGLLEEHFRPGAVMDREGLAELREARRALCPEGSRGVLCIIPHGVFTDARTGEDDHFIGEHTAGGIKALALVVEDEAVEAVVKVYFAFHPTPFPVKVFSEEMPARHWLTEQLGQDDGRQRLEQAGEPFLPVT